MKIMKFIVDDWIETRSDNPNFVGYKVVLDTNKYILYYDKDFLREVYFIGLFKDYFMSCRANFTTISHYYISNEHKRFGSRQIIKRYENNIHNQSYYSLFKNLLYCDTSHGRRFYRSFQQKVPQSPEKLKTDLITFLNQFYSLGLDKYFCPEEPKA